MVKGFDTFKEVFKGYEDCYTIIGGTACDILMDEAGLDFRATKDIDMILLLENRYEEFAKIFWSYVKAGGYKYGWKSSEGLHFFRFTKPSNSNYPLMIELFSKHPDYAIHDENSIFIPLHISDEISSLSAILLNDDYYHLMQEGRRIVDGVAILGAEFLIPFKARAWIDLSSKKLEGHHVNADDIKKHKNDVFRLFRLISPSNRITISELVKEDMAKFIEAMPDENINMQNLGLEISLEEVLHILRNIYL